MMLSTTLGPGDDVWNPKPDEVLETNRVIMAFLESRDQGLVVLGRAVTQWSSQGSIQSEATHEKSLRAINEVALDENLAPVALKHHCAWLMVIREEKEREQHGSTLTELLLEAALSRHIVPTLGLPVGGEMVLSQYHQMGWWTQSPEGFRLQNGLVEGLEVNILDTLLPNSPKGICAHGQVGTCYLDVRHRVFENANLVSISDDVGAKRQGRFSDFIDVKRVIDVHPSIVHLTKLDMILIPSTGGTGQIGKGFGKWVSNAHRVLKMIVLDGSNLLEVPVGLCCLWWWPYACSQGTATAQSRQKVDLNVVVWMWGIIGVILDMFHINVSDMWRVCLVLGSQASWFGTPNEMFVLQQNNARMWKELEGHCRQILLRKMVQLWNSEALYGNIALDRYQGGCELQEDVEQEALRYSVLVKHDLRRLGFINTTIYWYQSATRDANGILGPEKEEVIDEPIRGVELEQASFFGALDGKVDGVGIPLVH
ncbi:hypothetical protein EDB19DRAFT_1827115 [Suillus lakei]|nr:hypothetical protein EDB19DRAFT_1827115 [Suillus lakei]